MKTGWTSLGSAARCPQGRGGWSRGLISCFLHHAGSGLRSPLSSSLARARRQRDGETDRARSRDSDRGKPGAQGGRKKGTRPAFPAAVPPRYTYSDCRFKCLLITKLVPQPPRSRSLCIFISTSYGRFREREDVSYSSAAPPTPPSPSPPRRPTVLSAPRIVSPLPMHAPRD